MSAKVWGWDGEICRSFRNLSFFLSLFSSYLSFFFDAPDSLVEQSLYNTWEEYYKRRM